MLHRACLLRHGAAGALVTEAAAQVVEVCDGDRRQSLVARVAKAVKGTLGELAGGRARKRAVQRTAQNRETKEIAFAIGSAERDRDGRVFVAGDGLRLSDRR